MTLRVACVIPAFDAARTLPAVLDALRRSLPAAVLIGIDDGSTDDTPRVLEALADVAVRHHRNRGKGVALRTGIAAAKAAGATAVVTIDADGQHDAAFAPRLMAALVAADLVIGARARDAGMPVGRRVTNYLSAAATRAIAGLTIGDVQSGFRAIRMALLDAVVAYGDRYEWETDLLLRAARGGWRIASVPVPTLYGPPSHFRPVRDALRVVRTFCRHAGRAPS